MTRAHGKSAHQALLVIGVLYIVLALLLNELTIARWAGVDRLGPVSRLVLRVLDAAAVSWGVLTIAYRRRTLVANTNLTLMVTALLVLSVEGVLHAFPGLLGRSFANGIVSKYTWLPGGIYYFDPVVRINFMLPSHRTEMVYNGYTWQHHTDQFGFRNPDGRSSASIVLLGDSFIYGHGVDIEHTVGYALERLTGRTVYNLGQQGDTSLQEAYLLTEQISRLHPRVVLYFFCQNDIRDLYDYRTDTELETFIETPVEAISFPSRMNVPEALQLREAQNAPRRHPTSLIAIARQSSYLARLYDWHEFLKNQRAFAVRISDRRHDENHDGSLGWQYTKHAVAYMNRLAAQHQATLVVVPIPAINKRLISILKEVATQEAVPFVDTGSMDPADPSNAALYLPHDGHFSDRGARTMASLIQDYLAKNPSLFSRGPS